MAKKYEVTLGKIGTLIFKVVWAKFIAETRATGIQNVRGYQHRHKEVFKVPFMEVYSNDSEESSRAAQKIYWSPAVRPESYVEWIIDKAVVIYDDTADMPLETWTKIIAIVIARPCHGDVTRRLKVTLEDFRNSIGAHTCYRYNVDDINLNEETIATVTALMQIENGEVIEEIEIPLEMVEV